MALAVAGLAWSGPALGKPASECVRAANEGQALRDQGRLLSARDELVVCARPACPKVVAAECRKWLEDVAARIPIVVVSLRDGSGADVSARVLVDGQSSEEATAGRAIALDPGPHVFRAESDRGVAERSVVVREREAGQRVVLELPKVAEPKPKPAAQPPVTETHRPVPTFTWLMAGTAVVGAGVGTVFAIDAGTRFGDLKERCPSCTEDEVSGLRMRSTVADVAFGVAIVAAGITVVSYLLRPTVTTTRPAATLVF
ncbi:MAG: hypothetical protein U0183_14245 [Polyangiaceae bacterium]